MSRPEPLLVKDSRLGPDGYPVWDFIAEMRVTGLLPKQHFGKAHFGTAHELVRAGTQAGETAIMRTAGVAARKIWSITEERKILEREACPPSA